MNKGKFASLIMLGAFSAGVASSSAVSAQGDSNLASTVDISIGSHDESAVAFDETNIDAETTTDEETKNAITDENNDSRDDTENLDKDINDKADSPEDSDKENSKNKDYVFVADDKKQNVKKGNGVETVKGFAIAGIGASAVSGATFGISKLVKSSGNNKKDEPSPETNPEPNNSKDQDDDSVKKDVPTSEPSTDSTADPNPESDKPTGSEEEEKEPEKKDEPSPDPTPEPEPGPKLDPKKKEEKGGFVEWYKNNLLISLPVTFVVGYIFVAIISAICCIGKRGKFIHYTPFRGKFGFSERIKETNSTLETLWICFKASLVLSWMEFYKQ